MAGDGDAQRGTARRLGAPRTLRPVPSPDALRVVVVVGTRVFRDALVASLSADARVDVVAAASPGATALARARELHPDVVLLDMTAPGSAALCRRLAARRAPRVVGLGVADDDRDVARCRHAGAATHVPASATVGDLVDAVVRIGATAAPVLVAEPVAGPLTRREEEVALLLAEGRSNREIAAELGLSLSTVKHHVHHVLGKLGVPDRSRVAERVPARPVTAGEPPGI